MGIRTNTPLTEAHIDNAQNGIIILQYNAIETRIGDEGGYGGSGSQTYLEALCGKECGSYTSADNTTGTLFFPDIEYFTNIFGLSRDASNVTHDSGIQGKSIYSGSNYDDLARTGSYDPSDASNYLFLATNEFVFGRFSRIVLEKPTGNLADRNKIILTKGPGDK